MNTTLTYADLSVDRVIYNRHTGEHATITALGNARVEITLTSGPDQGEEITDTPHAIASNWALCDGVSCEDAR